MSRQMQARHHKGTARLAWRFTCGACHGSHDEHVLDPLDPANPDVAARRVTRLGWRWTSATGWQCGACSRRRTEQESA